MKDVLYRTQTSLTLQGEIPLIGYVALDRFYPGFTTPERIAQIQELLDQLSSDAGTVSLKTISGLVSSTTSFALLAIDEQKDRRVVGIAVLNFVHMFAGAEARLDEVCVHPQYHGRGIGRKLVLELVTHARTAGAMSMELTCAPHRTSARALYTSLGFTQRNTGVFVTDPL